jgi:hypothetical protein
VIELGPSTTFAETRACVPADTASGAVIWMLGQLAVSSTGRVGFAGPGVGPPGGGPWVAGAEHAAHASTIERALGIMRKI